MSLSHEKVPTPDTPLEMVVWLQFKKKNHQKKKERNKLQVQICTRKVSAQVIKNNLFLTNMYKLDTLTSIKK